MSPRSSLWIGEVLVLLAAGTMLPACRPRAAPAPSPPPAPASVEPEDAEKDMFGQPLRMATLTGTIVREGDEPAPGVGLLVGDTNLPMWEGFDETETDEQGRFTIRYPITRKWAIRVNCEFADIQGVEGVEEYDPNRNIFGVPDPARPLRFRLKRMEECGKLRCVDAGTGEVLRGDVRREFARGPGEPFETFYDSRPSDGGWIVVWEGGFPLGAELPVSPDSAEVRISVPGYAPVTRRNGNLRGWVTIPLEPTAADVTGAISIPKHLRGARVTCHLVHHGAFAKGAPPFRGVPHGVGTFHLHHVPAGRYTLHVSVEWEGRFLRAERTFERGEKPLDLGTIELKPGARARIRVVDRGGQNVPRAGVVLRALGDAGPDATRSVNTLEFGDRGWIDFSDLKPGARYRATAVGPDPAPSLEFTAPGAEDEPASVEVKCEAALVPCRVRLLFEGTPYNPKWDEVRETYHPLYPAKPEGPTGHQWYLGEALPGAYTLRFVEDAEHRKAGESPARLEGTFTVAPGERFESTVDLRRPGERR